ncbi:RNA polymerase sigma factor sigA isoform X2 [Coffea arabica]|uniref:RNA polymerase sigma factor sigA isoform X2 n=1 Tax=Coffea arabica TaxID=13443 RepID=A0A6P6VN83_COFAR|nr:RNA polymerase sigma factor sigA-like [Coffea arabica]XP_027103411.1 RNA polymerase sigma factor sigA-like [Coffea arabica]XP_027103412.1 RNA polymerase sigma factor sigA-like [Coffea arabica]XP_027103413.1 RNA polymerase sigma factor sigA-like [Coffea arabica]
MATAAVIGLSPGKRLLSSASYYSDLFSDKLSCTCDHFLPVSSNSVLAAKRSSNFSPKFLSRHKAQPTYALKEHAETAPDLSNIQPWLHVNADEEFLDPEFSMQALLLLQKSMLEKQWNLSAENDYLVTGTPPTGKTCVQVTSSGSSARRRRIDSRRHPLSSRKSSVRQLRLSRHLRSIISPELLQNRLNGYVKGVVSEELLTHAEVVQLSEKIKQGLCFEEQKARLRKRLGCEPSEEQLATSLKITRADLQSKFIECSLARERLAMSNVRLVMSIAQRYDNMGAEMADLIQGGLIGLLRGIEKYDSSKGFKISTYVYWWIRQGVSRALVENSRTLRLPTHLHERLSLIRNAKIRLEEKGITPSVDKIAESLNMSQKKVRNATEAVCKVISLDREAFPSLNGLPGETLHSYIADNRLENNPWHGVDQWALKDEVNKLITSTLRERERDIIRLYYGLENECLTWEDISKRIGLSRERVRQVGLVALEKLKYAARKRRLEAMIARD